MAVYYLNSSIMGKKKPQEINASSMADIAFLLLIFFLVTTTMDIDKGLLVILPPYSEEEPDESDVNKRNMLNILVNNKDMLLVKGEPINITELRELTKTHVNNNGQDPRYSDSPDKAIVSLKNHRGTSYDMYIKVQNELRAAYNELRTDYSMNKFGVTFDKLDDLRKKEVRAAFPLRISEADPDKTGGGK